MKIALFFGAGASVPYGMPTTKELRDKIDRKSFPRKDLLSSRHFPDIEHVLSVIDQLINFVQSRAGKLYTRFDEDKHGAEDYDDMPEYEFEELAHAAHALDERNAGKFKSYVARSRSSREIIENLITKNYRWDPSLDESAEKILRPLFDLARSREGHVTIFTTNYDTVIEAYCGNPDRRIERIDGFKFHTAMRAVVWDGNFIPHDDNARTKVFLYKLHGSMNWLADAAVGRQLILQKPDTGASDDRARDMYIRPSLDTKEEATRTEPYATILRQFARLLPTFDACIVIGYSFRDSHVTEMLVEFAEAGKALVVLSPTGAADFRSNALGKKAGSRRSVGWSRDTTRRIVLESDGGRKIVRILNERLDENDMDGITGRIKSAIGDDSPDGKEGGDAEAGE